MSLPIESAPALESMPGVQHAFFGRRGGISNGEFAGLNVSTATGDDPDTVAVNRRHVADALGGAPLLTLRQIHSNRVAVVKDAADWQPVDADAMVTDRPDVLLGILTADCAPLLLADPQAAVIGAAHAGWRGAVDGILGQTIVAMEMLGARRERIIIALGPTISGVNYEVGPDFMRDVVALAPEAAQCFHRPEGKREHFDLPAFVSAQSERLGVAQLEQVGGCTYAAPERYFSHRYATHHGGRTGRQIAVIGLTSV